MSNFNIDGLDQFMSAITRMPQQLDTEVKQAVKNRTLELETNAKLRSPVGETGNLRRSINTQIDETNNSITGEVSTNVEYAIYVEHGTSKQSAQPFMTPSYVNSSNRLKDDLERIMEGLSND